MAAAPTFSAASGYANTGSIIPSSSAPPIVTKPTPPPVTPPAPINRPVLTPPPTAPAAVNPQPMGTPATAAPRNADDIYGSYVKQGQSILDRINSIYDSAIQSANTSIDTAASGAQKNQSALASASGLLGSSAAVRGSTAIATDAAGKKEAAARDIRSKQAGDVANYLSQLQSAAQTQANEEKTTYPTLDAYYKSQAGTAFKGLAATGVDWDKFASTPGYEAAYNQVVSDFGGDPAMAKLAYIAANKDSTQSQYLNQEPIQDASGNWIFLKQTIGPDGNMTVVPDKVNVGAALSPGQSLATLGGKPYAVTKADDGTLTYKPITPPSTTSAAGFTLGANQSRYELNPTTGSYELVAAKGAASTAGPGSFDITSLPTDVQQKLKDSGFTQYSTDAQSLAQDIVTGNMAPTDLSKRATGNASYNDILTAAKQYSLATTGKPFDIAEANRNYKYAIRPQTQDTLNFLGSLVGSDDGTGNLTGGNMDELVSLSNGITRTTFPALNDAAAWARYSTGDPKIAEFQAVATEVADQVAKILQGGGTGAGTSDAKLQQAVNLFNTSFTKSQLTGVVNALKPLLTNRAKNMVKDNPYLSTYADQFGFAQNQGGTQNISAQAAAAGYDYQAMKTDGFTDQQIEAALKGAQ